MSNRLAGRIAIVTGAGRGIGHGIALGYAREGAKVALVSRNPAELQALAEAIRANGGEALEAPADVRDSAAVNAVVEQVVAQWGGVDALVNAAGIPMAVPTTELTDDKWQMTLDININGTFFFCRAVAPHMIAKGRGTIINIGSLHSFQGIPMRAAYAASKGGVLQLTRSLATEWAPHGVRVNCISPGWIRTPLQDEMVRQGRIDRTPIIARTPIRRIGEVSDIVGPAIFLASDESAFIVGEQLIVDGGWGIYGFY
ncbi:MAG: glucose 1-dehydrogenase [Chloroflexales bacterium]|nr:glucose 1-dehydrogenase [Chloroflexales bacterium]